MALGLKKGEAKLYDHDPKWETDAAEAIKQLQEILGLTAINIQHVGSTSIRTIKAKPVIDIVVAANNLDEVLALTPTLNVRGFIFRGWAGKDKEQLMYQYGEYISSENIMRILTHFVHIVKADSQNWHDYINLRDYMNAFPTAASEYEALKVKLADEYKNDYISYHKGKSSHIVEMIDIANRWNDSGRSNAR